VVGIVRRFAGRHAIASVLDVIHDTLAALLKLLGWEVGLIVHEGNQRVKRLVAGEVPQEVVQARRAT